MFNLLTNRYTTSVLRKPPAQTLSGSRRVATEEMCLQRARLMCAHADHMREEFRGCIISLDMYRLHLNHQSKAVIQGLSNALNLITL